MCASTPFPTGPNDDLLETTLQRYQRTLGFAGTFALDKRREFDLLWLRPTAFGPKAAEFRQRIDGLRGKVRDGKNILKYAQGQPARAAFNSLSAFDLKALTAATKGLETLAAELKAHPGIQAAMGSLLTTPDAPPGGTGPLSTQPASTGPLDGHAKTGRLTALLKSWSAQASIVLAGPTPAEVAAESADRLLTQNKQALGAAIDLVADVLKSVSPRLHLMEVALSTTGLPGKPRRWDAIEADIPAAGEAAGLSAAQVGWLFHLADLYLADARAMQLAHMAIVRGGQAQLMLSEAQMVSRTLLKAPPVKAASLLRDFNLGRFRASAHPLSHLHMSFKGISILQDLFPDPM